MRKILEIEDLHTYFHRQDSDPVRAVEGVTFSLYEGEILGLVGESACGKSVTALSVMKLLPEEAEIVKGRILFSGRDIVPLPENDMRGIRGKGISMVFQEPKAALNPLWTIGFQVAESVTAHKKGLSSKQTRQEVLSLLEKVELLPAEIKADEYPHRLSGGEAQRAMIAIALASHPSLLIADEPTTSLDVTIENQIVDLFRRLKNEEKFSFIFITHDLSLCAELADRIAVMYAGKIVEVISASEIMENALHPYTKALVSSLPQNKKGKGRFSVISGNVPEPDNKPKGCYFHPRCGLKSKICLNGYPKFVEVSPGHGVSCYNV